MHRITAEIPTFAEMNGIQETRACIMPDKHLSQDGVTRVPYVDFDSRNQKELPCNAVISELGGVRPDFPVPTVPRKGCIAQRQAGLCPRGLALTPQEIEPSNLEKSRVAK